MTKGFGRPWRWVPAARGKGSRPPPEAPGLPAPVPGEARRRLGSASRTSGAGRPFPGPGARRRAGPGGGGAARPGWPRPFPGGRCPRRRPFRPQPPRATGPSARGRAAEGTVRAGRRGRAARGRRTGASGRPERTALGASLGSRWFLCSRLMPLFGGWWGGGRGWSRLRSRRCTHRAGPTDPVLAS